MQNARSWTYRIVIALFAILSAAWPVEAQEPTRFELTAEGNEARYRVREQFLSVDFPSDAVGSTTAISGGITLDAGGNVVPGESRFDVDVTALRSDSETRDRNVRMRILHTDQYPTVRIDVRELRGLSTPWPATGTLAFELVGDLTIHGVTRSQTWQVTAEARGDGLSGRATTSFTFGDFGMPVPSSFRLLTVEDNVRLEYDFSLAPAG